MGRVKVFQEYRVSVSGLKNSFDYLVEPQEGDAPLPADASGAGFDCFTLKRDQTMWLNFPVEVGLSPVSAQQVYHYILRPATPMLPGGLFYVDLLDPYLHKGVNVYYLELYVQLSSADASLAYVIPVVHIEGWDGPKVTDPGWRIGYEEPKQQESSTHEATAKTSSPLAKTGDTSLAPYALASAACGGALLLTGRRLRHRRRGGRDA